MSTKTLKINEPTFDLQVIAAALVKMDIPDDVVADIPSKTSVPGKLLRRLFEELHDTNRLDFTKTVHERYQDNRVEAAYLSFKFALTQHRKAIKNAQLRLRKSSVEGPFIVGMQVTDGTVQFGYRPYKHSSLAKAKVEADKLRDRNNKSYTIFGVVGHSVLEVNNHARINTPVEETRQGFAGKKVRSPFKVMEDWKKIIQENDLTATNIPVSIGFLASGKHCINFSMSQEIVTFEEYSQCIEFINRWIHDYRATHVEMKEETNEPCQAD